MDELWRTMLPAFLFIGLIFSPLFAGWYFSLPPSNIPQTRICPICGKEAKLKNVSPYCGATYWCDEVHSSEYKYSLGYWYLRYAD